MTIAGGDLITATVSVAGKHVTVALNDKTRHESFAKTITDHAIDVTSAEWITEVPSDCSTATTCESLALADFGAVQFANASAETSAGRTASISSSMWHTTKMLLGYSEQGTAFVAKTTTPHATPSVLEDGGRAFRVEYSGVTTTTTTGSGSGGTGSTGTGSTGTGSGGTGGINPGGGPGGGGPGGGPGGFGGGPGGLGGGSAG
jgi:hypothetical protein